MSPEEQSEIARLHGRLEATIEAQGRESRAWRDETAKQIDGITKRVEILADRVLEHEQIIADVRESARRSSEDLSEHLAHDESFQRALARHMKQIDGELQTIHEASSGLHKSTEAQDVVLKSQSDELNKQTKLLRSIKTWSPVITAVASVAGAAVGAYYAHLETVARMLGGH